VTSAYSDVVAAGCGCCDVIGAGFSDVTSRVQRQLRGVVSAASLGRSVGWFL